MPNWKQEIAEAVTAMEEVSANPALLTYQIDTLDDFFGGASNVVEIQRRINAGRPSPVNVRLVDGLRYRAGDFICPVSYLTLKAAHDPLQEDPEITIGESTKTLAETRPFTPSENWGIKLGKDSLTIGGAMWKIIAVEALGWLDAEPSKFNLTLRR